MRCMRRATGRAASKHDVPGLRQWRHLQKSVKMRFNKVLTTRRANPKHIKAYLACCTAHVRRVEVVLPKLAANGGITLEDQEEQELPHARCAADQSGRPASSQGRDDPTARKGVLHL